MAASVAKAKVQFEDGEVKNVIIIPEGENLEIGEGANHKLKISSGIEKIGASIEGGVLKLSKEESFLKTLEAKSGTDHKAIELHAAA